MKHSAEIKAKIKAHEAKISTLSSSDLLEYSKDLKRGEENIGEVVVNHLFGVIDLRTKELNNQSVAVFQSRDSDMIASFMSAK